MADFAKRKEIERWLEDKPTEVAVVIATRAALRVIPALARDFRPRGSDPHEAARDTVLPVWCAVAAAWVRAKYPIRLAYILLSSKSASTPSSDYAANAAYGPSPDAASTAVVAAATAAVSAAFSTTAATSAGIAATAASAADVAATAAYSAAYNYAAYIDTSSGRSAASFATAGTAAITAAYAAVFEDASAVDRGMDFLTLADRPLWPHEVSEWVREDWLRLKRALLALNEGWDVWTDWYEARRDGRSAVDALEVARVTIAEEIWKQGSKVLNAEIKRLIDEHAKTSSKSRAARGFNPVEAFAESLKRQPQQTTDLSDLQTETDPQPPIIPARRPAAIEPVWLKGRLTVPTRSAKADLNKKKFEAALSALRAELRELADDVRTEANIDKRPAEFLRRLAERVPETMPRQDELFRLGHVEALFAGYAKTVDQEWPDFLASRYHAISLQFDRTLRQVPLWREFKRNAAKETLSVAQIADSTSLAREAASALQQGEAASFVDPAIPHSLEQLADALPAADTGEKLPPDLIEAGKDLLAADLVESVNNTLKPIAEVALTAAGDYADGFRKGFKKAAKKQGPIDGEKAFKWLRRLAIGGGAGAGSFVVLSNLIAKFPEAFAWLERVLHFLR